MKNRDNQSDLWVDKTLSKLFPQCDGSPWDLYHKKMGLPSIREHFNLALQDHTYEKLDDLTKLFIKCCQDSNEIAKKKGYDLNALTDDQIEEVYLLVQRSLPDETTDEERAMFE